MTSIFVLRHPQTTWNLAERYQGRLDAPLSATGRRQSRQIVEALRSERFEAVYTSPLSRARDLALVVAENTSSPLFTDSRLTEIALGPWEGLFRSQIESRFSSLYRRWYDEPDTVHFPAGESAVDVQRRVLSVMSMLTCRYHAGSVLVVTHAVVIQTLVAASLGLPLARLHRVRVNNGSVTTFRADTGVPYLITMNGLELVGDNAIAAVATDDRSGNHEGRATA